MRDDDGAVRAAALDALQRVGRLDADVIAEVATDPHVAVRRRAAELAARHPDVDLLVFLDDDDPTVIEIAAWSCGEHESGRDPIVARLIELADHDDALVRESAVAALGAIGDPRAVPTIIAAATEDKPAVRRRAVLALAPFEGDDVDAAIASALEDRDWQVRQSAEELA
ncbi:MAG: HEAT repeat domain-containing protein [Actinomycetota bacterium]